MMLGIIYLKPNLILRLALKIVNTFCYFWQKTPQFLLILSKLVDNTILVKLAGDSDKTAWKDHITPYYLDNIESDVLSASHHGSRSFFKNGEDDENPFKEHIERINPEYLVISAPKNSEHDHPHDDALEIYKEYVPKENIFHLGEKEQSIVVDIDSGGVLQAPYWSDLNTKTDNKHTNNQFKSDVFYTTKSQSKPYCSACR